MSKFIDLEGLRYYNTKVLEKIEETKSSIPTKTSQLNNDSNFITGEDIPTDIATETYVNTQISNLIDSAPETLNTLNELAVAIQENDTVIDTLNSAIGNKADKTQLTNYLPLTGGTLSDTLSIKNTSSQGKLILGSTDDSVYIRGNQTNQLYLVATNEIILRNGGDSSDNGILVTNDGIHPELAETKNLGTSSIQWNNIFAKTIYQNGEQVASQSAITNINTKLNKKKYLHRTYLNLINSAHDTTAQLYFDSYMDSATAYTDVPTFLNALPINTAASQKGIGCTGTTGNMNGTSAAYMFLNYSDSVIVNKSQQIDKNTESTIEDEVIGYILVD